MTVDERRRELRAHDASQGVDGCARREGDDQVNRLRRIIVRRRRAGPRQSREHDESCRQGAKRVAAQR